MMIIKTVYLVKDRQWLEKLEQGEVGEVGKIAGTKVE
jgi:hypothetical protein